MKGRYLKTKDIWPTIQGYFIDFVNWLFRPPGFFHDFWCHLFYEHHYGKPYGSVVKDEEEP